MSEQQDQLRPEQSDDTMETDDMELDADDILSEMYQREMITDEMKPKWKELGVQLRLSYGELNTIDEDATQKANETCGLKMLEKWRVQYGDAATPDKLITALKACGEDRYAAQLQKAADKGTFGKDYTDNKIASDIAPYWDNVGIYLGVKRLSNIKDNNSPTEYKFKGVLRKWLKQEQGSKDEIYKKFHEALKGVELVTAAEKFYEIALKPQEITDDIDDDDEDMDHAVPN